MDQLTNRSKNTCKIFKTKCITELPVLKIIMRPWQQLKFITNFFVEIFMGLFTIFTMIFLKSFTYIFILCIHYWNLTQSCWVTIYMWGMHKTFNEPLNLTWSKITLNRFLKSVQQRKHSWVCTRKRAWKITCPF